MSQGIQCLQVNSLSLKLVLFFQMDGKKIRLTLKSSTPSVMPAATNYFNAIGLSHKG